MNTLLAWPISRRTPSTSTGSNGEPVATMARPSVQRRTSAGVASAAEVGFESGMTIGRAVPAASARDDRLVERAADPGRADQDGRPDPLDRLDQARVLGREAVSGERVGRQASSRLVVVEVLAPVVDQAARIDEHDGPADVGLGQPVVEHREPEQPGDADPRRARPDQHDARVGERASRGRAGRPGRRPPRPRRCPGCRR